MNPDGAGLYLVGYLISRWYFQKTIRQLARNLLIQVHVAIDIGHYELARTAEHTTDAIRAFADALGDIDAQERALFNEATSDIAGRRTSPDSRQGETDAP